MMFRWVVSFDILKARLLILFIKLIVNTMGCVGGGDKKPESQKQEHFANTGEPEQEYRDGGVPRNEPEGHRQDSRPAAKLS